MIILMSDTLGKWKMFGVEILNNFSNARQTSVDTAEPEANSPLVRKRELPRFDTKANIRPSSKVNSMS